MVFFTVSPFPAADCAPSERPLWPFVGLLGLLCGAGLALSQLTPATTPAAQPVTLTQVNTQAEGGTLRELPGSQPLTRTVNQ